MKHIVIRPQLYLLLPLMFLFPSGWILSWLIAATLHEFFHLMVLRLFGVRIRMFEIGISGAKIITEPMTPGKEFVTALAGPIGALTLLAFSQYFPKVTVCAFAQSLYNLLPVYPLDGGRALRCLLIQKLRPKWLLIWERCIFLAIVIVILWLSLRFKLGMLSFVLVITLGIQHGNTNIPCKD